MIEPAAFWTDEERLCVVGSVLGMAGQFLYMTTLGTAYRVFVRTSGARVPPKVELCLSMGFQLEVLAASVLLLGFAVRPGVGPTSRWQLLLVSALFSILSAWALGEVGGIHPGF